MSDKQKPSNNGREQFNEDRGLPPTSSGTPMPKVKPPESTQKK